ncbi:MAG: DUF448 domain-containing protein [Lachnospiraceae bacterium]|nr:DUF448 domain-containing protein [Lachnospiraceae bacterium]
MEEARIPHRMCTACGKRRIKEELFCFTVEAGCVVFAASGHNGRSAYLCRDKNCIGKALKKGSLSKSLKAQMTPEFLEKLSEIVENAG